MDSFRRIVRIAQMEWSLAARSRRMLVIVLLFAAVAGVAMYGTISAFSVLEEQVVETLRLPSSESAGSVTMTLWKSKPFVRIMEHFAGSSLVFADIKGRHPILLAYALFLFQIVAFLTLVVSAPKIADDVRSGAARYWLVRVTRGEWTLGKFVGEALLLISAILVGAFAAWGVVLARLPVRVGVSLLPELLNWSARAGIYAIGWLGVFLGLSHVVRTGAKATALGILALIALSAFPTVLEGLARIETISHVWLHLDLFSPSASSMLLWRSSPAALFQGFVQLLAISLFYLSLGAGVFGRRDV